MLLNTLLLTALWVILPLRFFGDWGFEMEKEVGIYHPSGAGNQGWKEAP